MQVLAPELFHREYLESGKRLDHRQITDGRAVTITHKCLDDFPSSSLVSLGKTIVVTAVSIKPQPISPSLTVNVQRSVVSTVKGKSSCDKTLTAMLLAIAPKILSPADLEIARPDPHDIYMTAVKVWSFNLDIHQTIISDDGAVEVALILGFEEALSCLELPIYTLDSECQLVQTPETRQLPLLPITGMRFGLLNDMLFFDPTNDEEKIIDGCCTIIMSKEDEPKILKLSTTGTFCLTEELIANMVNACCK
ncbi:exosome complex component RRP45 [Histomonas meleagridis]|uniref:exosome complex component RRP45 n=1 Tax=Histomonas meleagridis TaxID=135588 RepID=UPI00355ACADD|nr:exosome complex component RRP45 [Histomonas meleagridis]KAH0801758.1 exosome complex component RRP45 [Histomonas meleagridis]